MFQANVITDSVSGCSLSPRLLTMELVYPRFIHAELMTHRVFSRNASSSRAIPVARMLQAIKDAPAAPAEWRMNEAGMQGWTVANEVQTREFELIWQRAMLDAIRHAEAMAAAGAHKQHVNRITEPYQHIRVVLTSACWDNWDALRRHADAEPSIQMLANLMAEAREASVSKVLNKGDWHLPYVTDADVAAAETFLAGNDGWARKQGMITPNDVLCRVSTARCARVSYRTHDGKPTDIRQDLELHDKLVGSQPIHASPAEHQATPDWSERGYWQNKHRHGNLHGWQQYRKFLPGENLDIAA